MIIMIAHWIILILIASTEISVGSTQGAGDGAIMMHDPKIPNVWEKE